MAEASTKINSKGDSTEEELKDADLKVILLGDSAVGKSKLVERFLMEDYNPRQLSTYALTLFRHNATVDGKAVSVDFWDTAGQERFNKLHAAYYHGAHACILVFDVTRQQTYKHLGRWLKELRETCEHIPVICIANKIDVNYKVVKKTFKFPEKHKMPFFFVSAADGTNVVKMFKEGIRQGWNHKQNPPEEDIYAQVANLFPDETIGSKAAQPLNASAAK